MIVYMNSEIYTTLLAYLFFLLVSIGGLVLVSVIIPNQESNGHGIRWIKEIPWLQKIILFVIPILMFSIMIVFLAIPVGKQMVYLIKMKQDHFDTLELPVDSIDFKEELYRGKVIGYHMIYSDGNDRVEAANLFSKSEMSNILTKTTIALYWGYIEDDIEIWKIEAVY